MYLPITLTAAAAAAFINLWLTLRVGMVRTTRKISIGDGGDEELIRRMRAQANFIENTPIVLILIAAIEASRPASGWLAGVALVYTLGRVAHGIGMDGGPLKGGRPLGTLITMATLLGLAVWAVTIALDR
ncbi:membrane-associated proteins in eicosanoid and glutathione metabolism (MAPEG) [Novosphingobium nitrogenifigens DSM 19370]|uniref:Membrane-associated proteins in eicosanoid and glutathione metabolism (MAPEG) n=1 Tax=Novosphingobium nitrogenifigens DSM 19370 TaxID=983920 RepID=F1Z8P5_9SPHN|nr:MAPEG family protein [Novosphingobium nitrogenifigens]EGD58980.1 membrane-associated proteins in eicosanoid and glutathione metabolism (MAPEG) [Novosphingobium nitrogenifigens DSM 19370]